MNVLRGNDRKKDVLDNVGTDGRLEDRREGMSLPAGLAFHRSDSHRRPGRHFDGGIDEAVLISIFKMVRAW